MLNRRRMLIEQATSGGGGILPSGYTQLNYIEFTGTQYINTGIIPVNTDDFSITLQASNNTLTTQWLFGERDANAKGTYALIFFKQSTSNMQFRLTGADIRPSSWYDLAAKVYTIESIQVNYKWLYIDGVEAAGSPMRNDATPSVPIHLGNAKLGNSMARDSGHFKCYAFTLENNNGELRWNGIPCLDNNNVPCMYDTVSQTPFYNIGTGDLLYG